MNNSKDNPKAILLILIGMTVFALQDTFIKLLSNDTNIYLIYFIRCLIGLMIIISYLKIKKVPIIFKTHYPILTVLRGTIFFIGFSLYYYSLTELSLALAVTLFFVSPFFITIFSMLIIKEHIGLRRWISIFVGFIGVYLVMDPKFSDFNIFSIFPVICAICYALTVVIQKKTSDKDNLYSQVLHIYIAAIFFSMLIKSSLGFIEFNPETIEKYSFLLIKWNIPDYINFIMLIAIGLTGVMGFLCLFHAYNIGSPATIAPFEYFIILWAILISWTIWGETLNLKAYFGLILIIAAGIYTFLREKYLNKEISINEPMR